MISKKKGLRRNPKAFSDQNHKFSDQKQVISKKKRSSPKSEGFFWPKSQILTLFPPKNTNFFLPKKYRGRARKNSGGQTENLGGIAPLPPAGDAPDWCPSICFIFDVDALHTLRCYSSTVKQTCYSELGILVQCFSI